MHAVLARRIRHFCNKETGLITPEINRWCLLLRYL
jgi:hypothetical protein